MSSSVRIGNLTVPGFANTEEAEAWGEQQKPETQPHLRELHAALSELAVKSDLSLQRRADYATQAQLVREACEAVPNEEAVAP